MFKKIDWSQKEININGKYISNLQYADNIFIIADTQQQQQDQMVELNKESKKIGLRMNLNKTEVLFKEDNSI